MHSTISGEVSYRYHGSIKRHKAKLVARGFTQKVGKESKGQEERKRITLQALARKCLFADLHLVIR
jgi:hypothetical protein